MSVIGSSIRFFTGLFISLEILRQKIFSGHVSDFISIVAGIYFILALFFFIERDMRGAKSYLRFFTALIMSLTILVGLLFGTEISGIATTLAIFYFIMAMRFILKKAGFMR